MVEIKNYKGVDSKGNNLNVTIVSGPVIIKGGKVLLDKHGDDKFWKFPGGKIKDDESFQETAIREVKEELQIDVELVNDPYVMTIVKDDSVIILVHYLANIISGEPSKGRDVREFGWHNIADLPDDLAPNIKPVLNHFM